ncbi:glycerophosphodiester phosphodiesterase [Reyranella sp. CPCC 100927]|nr:glycerophosphodiester phosphodiesterase [Reyranella sp. CPCC 100927]
MARCILLIGLVFTGVDAHAQQGFDVQGHRGTRGLAPENTLAAFRKAMEIGVTTLETDLALTRDGTLVLSHEPLLNPDLTRDADGKWLTGPGPAIRSLTLTQIKAYDVGRLNPDRGYSRQWPEQVPVDGERIPSLAELVSLTQAMGKTQVRFNIETKLTPQRPEETPDPMAFATAVASAVRTHDITARTTVQSFDWRTLVALKQVAPEIATACLTIEASSMNTVAAGADGASPWHAGLKRADHGGSLPRLVKAAGCGTWSMFWRNLTPDLVKEAHALSLKVVPWTVNNPADMRNLMDMGADGLITDYPDRLRKVMAERGMTGP